MRPCGWVLAISLYAAPIAAQSTTWDLPEADGDAQQIVLERDLLTVSDGRCDREADAARIAGEIVVCRSLDEDSDEYWDSEAFARDYAARTMGVQTPDVDGSGLILPTEGSIFMVTVTLKLGEAREGPPLEEVDLRALPEAPPGSDAHLLARGLQP